MQIFTRDGDVISVFFLWFSYLQFELAGLSVELFMEEWIYDSHNLQFQQLHHDVLEVFTKVVSCQIISSEVGVKLLGLLEKQLWWCSVLLESLLEKKGSGFTVGFGVSSTYDLMSLESDAPKPPWLQYLNPPVRHPTKTPKSSATSSKPWLRGLWFGA